MRREMRLCQEQHRYKHSFLKLQLLAYSDEVLARFYGVYEDIIPFRRFWLTLACAQRYNVCMWRWLAVAALGTAFLTLSAWGQRGGGRASGGFAGHAGFSGGGHAMVGAGGSMMGARGFPGVQRGNVNLVIGSFGHPGFGHPGFGYPHGRYYRGWPYGGYYGYPYYGWGYGDDSYSSDSYQNYPVYDYSSAYAENDRQQAAIDRLENEVDRLRQEREARQSQSSSASAPKSALPPTELVFRDKHTEEVQNYAIVGQTFWILNAEKARKIPIAQLDIPATQKANEDRGVDFQLPE